MPPVLVALPAAVIAAVEAGAGAGIVIAGTTFTGLSAALIAGGTTLALGTVSALLTAPGSHAGPTKNPFGVAPDEPRTWCYGRAIAGGSLLYWETVGHNNKDLWMVIAVQDTPVDGFEEFYASNVRVDFSGNAATPSTIVLTNCTVTNNSAIITVSSTAALATGMPISGAHIPGGAKIYSVDSPTQIRMTRTATGSNSTETITAQQLTRYCDSDGSDPVMWRYDHLGSETQTADTNMVAASATGTSYWTSQCRLQGIAYYVWHMQYDATSYPTGIPQPSVVMRGRKVYDPRKDSDYGGDGSQSYADPSTWTWSQNAALCLLDYLLGVKLAGVRIGGCGIPIARIDVDSFIAAANVCDQQITLASGATEARYTINGFVDAIEDKKTVVDAMLLAMDGELVYNGGLISVIPGAAQTAVMDLYDGDLHGGPLNLYPSISRQEKVNTITSVYAEPAQLFATVSAPTLTVSDYVTADGGLTLETEIKHRFTSSLPTVQRLNKLKLGDHREQFTLDATYKPKAILISAGQTFNFNSALAGYTAQKMICLQRDLNEDGSVRILARQETDAKYTWSSSEEAPPPSFNTNLLLDPTVVDAPLTGDVSAAGVNVVGASGASVPGLLFTAAQPPNAFVKRIVTQFKLHADSTWIDGPSMIPATGGSTATIQAAAPGAVYDVRFGYVTDFAPIPASWTEKDSITAGANLISTGGTAGSVTTATLADGAITPPKFDTAQNTPIEILAAIPVTNLFDGRSIWIGGQYYAFNQSASTFVNVTVPKQLSDLFQRQDALASALISQSTAAFAGLQTANLTLAQAKNELTTTFTNGLYAQAQAHLELVAVVNGILGSTDVGLAARVTAVEIAEANLQTGKADATVVNDLYAQINTPTFGIAAEVTTLQAAVAILDPAGAAAAYKQVLSVVSGMQSAQDALGSAFIDLANALQNNTQQLQFTFAAVTTETNAKITNGISSEATARLDLEARLATNVANLAASVVTESSARVTGDSANAANITTLQAALTGYTGSSAVATAISSLTASVTTVSSTIGGAYTPSNTVATAINSNSTAITSLQSALTGYSGASAVATAISTLTTNVTTVSNTIGGAYSPSSTVAAAISASSSAITVLQNTLVGFDGTTTVAGAVTTLTTSITNKSTTFVQGTTPTAFAVGDLWIDTSNGNLIRSWTGAAWAVRQDLNKVTTFAQTGTPTGSAVGDIWINTTSGANTMSRWNGSSWVAVDNPVISATASSLTTLTSTVNGHTTQITNAASAISGLSAQWGVQINTDGNTIGLVKLDGTSGTSSFTVVADKFNIYQPGGVQPIFSLSGGVAYLNVPLKANSIDVGMIKAGAINTANMIVDNLIVTSKLTANAVTESGGFSPTSVISTTSPTTGGSTTVSVAGTNTVVTFIDPNTGNDYTNVGTSGAKLVFFSCQLQSTSGATTNVTFHIDYTTTGPALGWTNATSGEATYRLSATPLKLGVFLQAFVPASAVLIRATVVSDAVAVNIINPQVEYLVVKR